MTETIEKYWNISQTKFGSDNCQAVSPISELEPLSHYYLSYILPYPVGTTVQQMVKSGNLPVVSQTNNSEVKQPSISVFNQSPLTGSEEDVSVH